MPGRKAKKPNASPARSLGDIDARQERLPADSVNLTAAERKLLKDPDWIDEDEADLILAMRQASRNRPEDYVNIRDYIRSRGREVKD